MLNNPKTGPKDLSQIIQSYLKRYSETFTAEYLGETRAKLELTAAYVRALKLGDHPILGLYIEDGRMYSTPLRPKIEKEFQSSSVHYTGVSLAEALESDVIHPRDIDGLNAFLKETAETALVQLTQLLSSQPVQSTQYANGPDPFQGHLPFLR